MIQVATVYAPRPGHPKWMDYLPLIALQKRTVEHFGHQHVVVTDSGNLVGFRTLQATLPESLMHAQLAGYLAFLEAWDNQAPVVLADADVAIARDLSGAFGGAFDVGLTSRVEPESPINNGVMYVSAGSRDAALVFFRQAMKLCKDHWGGDQQAISQAAAPVHEKGDWMRHGVRIRFLSCKRFNMTPGVSGIAGKGNPFAVHFKGDRKHQMQPFADNFIFR